MIAEPATDAEAPPGGMRVNYAGWAMAILAVALVLRLYVAAQGGALFWTDEKRYLVSRDAVGAILEGDGAGAARFLLGTSDHLGFRWLALVPAAVERVVLGEAAPHARICAAFFALFSAANLWLVWRIALRVSGDAREALLALAFAASSNTLFFFSRHTLPYDASLTFFLWAVLVSVGRPGKWQSLGVGLLCAAGYLTYNGYWSIGAVVLIFDVVWRQETWGERGRRAGWGAVGLVAPLVVIVVLAGACGYDLVADARGFAGTVNQGDFGRGWRLALDYLPVADGALPVGLLGLVVMGVAMMLWRRRSEAWLRWVGMIVLLLGIWLLLSDVVYKFVLYGRTIRAAVPFLALAAAGAVAMFLRAVGGQARVLGLAGCGVLCVSGVWMMRVPLRQMFPVDFRRLAEQVKAEVRAREPGAVFQVLFDEYLFDYNFPEAPPAHRELLRYTHPQHFLPYLYEGYTEDQRPRYMSRDTAMRLIQLDASRGLEYFKKSPGAQWLAPYPGPLAIRLRLPKGKTGKTESLLLHGTNAAGLDRIIIHYVDTGTARLELRHGADEPRLSEPFRCDFEAEHRLTISLGSLYPPKGDQRFSAAPAFEAMTSRVMIRFDEVTLFKGAAAGTAAPLAGLRVGAGVPAEGTVGSFSGQISSVRQIDPRSAADADWWPTAADARCFTDYRGPVELTLGFPTGAKGRSEPLISSGVAGRGDLLFVTYEDEQQVSFGLDHWGSPLVRSKRVQVTPGERHRLVVSMGSLFPAGERAEYEGNPGLRGWRERLLVQLDGETVLSEPAEFHPAEPATVKIAACDTGASAVEKVFTGKWEEPRSLGPQVLGLGATGRPPVTGEFFGDYHGVVEMQLRFPKNGSGRAEPLLVSGQPGAGDQLYVRYVDPRHVTLGVDHWGMASLQTAPVEIDPEAVHRVVVSFGSLFPPREDARYTKSPYLRVLQKWLYVSLDGRVIFQQPFPFYRVEPDAVLFGRGLAGSMAAGPAFTGELLAIRHLDPSEAGLEERTLRGPKIEGATLPGGFAGAVQLSVQLGQRWIPGIEPLLITGELPKRDMFFVKYHGSKKIQIGFRHGDGTAVLSQVVDTKSGAMHTIRLSIGSLYPGSTSTEAKATEERQRVYVAIDGKVVLDATAETFPADARNLFLGVDPAESRGMRTEFFGKILGAQAVEIP